MPEDEGKTRGSCLPIAIWAVIIAGIFGIFTAFIALIPYFLDLFRSMPPPPTEQVSCIVAGDIIVRIERLENDDVIDDISSGESFFIQPNTVTQFRTGIVSVRDQTLPNLECVWTNDPFSEGRLVNKEGCRVEYRSGLNDVRDSISLQLSQQSCTPLQQYPFFIFPSP